MYRVGGFRRPAAICFYNACNEASGNNNPNNPNLGSFAGFTGGANVIVNLCTCNVTEDVSTDSAAQ